MKICVPVEVNNGLRTSLKLVKVKLSFKYNFVM